MPSGGCGKDNSFEAGWRIVPLLGTSNPIPLGSLTGQQEAVQSHIFNFPGSLGVETDLCQVEREGVRQWEQSRREDGVSVFKSFQREKGRI